MAQQGEKMILHRLTRRKCKTTYIKFSQLLKRWASTPKQLLNKKTMTRYVLLILLYIVVMTCLK
ncbi:hypothetical protein R3W88_008763 [Solanum pinnatisectum]|uniref:Uncharacterized protein n=1 Tax=Solanum pinnatisectum TaxID=50273 RepID=A0AAV9MCL5_9SOLN|nr:hypothetical protein R3W88_008763 [Solanum pinnatisectum]